MSTKSTIITRKAFFPVLRLAATLLVAISTATAFVPYPFLSYNINNESSLKNRNLQLGFKLERSINGISVGSRIDLTQTMRRFQVGYAEELNALDKRVRDLQEEKHSVQLHKLHMQFAFACWNEYIRTGNLKLHFTLTAIEPRGNDFLFPKQDAGELDAKSLLAQEVLSEFDLDLWKACLSRYGFSHVSFEKEDNALYNNDGLSRLQVAMGVLLEE